MNLSYTGKAFQQELLYFVRSKSAPRHKLSKECLKVLCFGIATGNNKLKLVATKKVSKPQLFKGS